MGPDPHRFWDVPELLQILFDHIDNRGVASRLARSHKTAWESSFRRIWGGEPLDVPRHLPNPNLNGTVAQHVQDAFLSRSSLVKSITISLGRLARSSKWPKRWYPFYPFSNLESVFVSCGAIDNHLDRFLPPSVKSVDIAIDPYPESFLSIGALISAAPHLINLKQFDISHSLSRDESPIRVGGIMDFLRSIPHPLQMSSFCFWGGIGVPIDLSPFVSSMPGLSTLFLDLRFSDSSSSDNPSAPLDMPFDSIPCLGLVHLVLTPNRTHPFNIGSLSRFKSLTDLTLLVDGIVKPVNLLHLRHLPLLAHVDIQLPHLSESLTYLIFEAFITSWTRLVNVVLLDSMRHDRGWLPVVGLQIEALELLCLYSSRLCTFQLAVGETPTCTSLHPKVTFSGAVMATVHLVADADVPRHVSYLDRLLNATSEREASPYGLCLSYRMH